MHGIHWMRLEGVHTSSRMKFCRVGFQNYVLVTLPSWHEGMAGGEMPVDGV
jgi:hypothetical protein